MVFVSHEMVWPSGRVVPNYGSIASVFYGVSVDRAILRESDIYVAALHDERGMSRLHIPPVLPNGFAPERPTDG